MDKINKERIMKMIKDNTLCICPFCKGEVYPRYRDYFLIGRSDLYWCPKCFRGKAGMFWREI